MGHRWDRRDTQKDIKKRKKAKRQVGHPRWDIPGGTEVDISHPATKMRTRILIFAPTVVVIATDDADNAQCNNISIVLINVTAIIINCQCANLSICCLPIVCVCLCIVCVAYIVCAVCIACVACVMCVCCLRIVCVAYVLCVRAQMCPAMFI